MFQDAMRKLTSFITQPIAKVLAGIGITANALTITGLLFGIAAGVFIALGRLKLAGILILIGGSFDMFDGAVARASNKNTPFGALLDSVVDRYSEGIIFLGLAIYFAMEGSMKDRVYGLIPTCLGLISAFLVSYVRARAEGLKLDCKVGLMQRPERVILLALGVLFQSFTIVNVSILIVALWILVILSHITVLQRVAFALRKLQGIGA
ncbi:MAG: CDP-diacylglycerol---glycerol-3-phosphate 3-phosphatidyltransferase [Candidatus Poribacteria bacterium]|nr:CDP-diacylglycerol---glycerol-3-phosphate 3-phosphatidyltransferase [Candidatus Poribacteria bacterium]MDQ1329402.1 CDP-diacylglycerol---glycerol-3-phosphate 3-phosphatidyltransferase [Candidatus Poribacteria bacterium]